MTTNNTDKRYVTLPIDPSRGYQVAAHITGWFGQFLTTGPHTHAVVSEYGTLHHGPWDADGAARFARSMGGPANHAVEVEPYFYCDAWGKVPAAAVHAVDELRANDWQRSPDVGHVLGSGEVIAAPPAGQIVY